MPKKNIMFGPIAPSKVLRGKFMNITPQQNHQKRQLSIASSGSEYEGPDMKPVVHTRRSRRKANNAPVHLTPPAKRPYKRRAIFANKAPGIISGADSIMSQVSMYQDPIPDFRPRIIGNSRTKNPGLDSLPGDLKSDGVDTLSLTAYYKRASVRFLPPNDYSNKDETTSGDLTTSSEPSSAEAIGASEISAAKEDGSYNIQFQELRVLEGHDGIWKTPSKDQFSQDCSWVVKGWFPSAQWFMRQLAPSSLNEILAYVESRIPDNTTYSNPQWAVFCSDIDQVANWEQGNGRDILNLGTLAPDFSFINHSIASLERLEAAEPVTILWSEFTNFTLENLPYDELEIAYQGEPQVTISLEPSSMSRGAKRRRQASETPADLVWDVETERATKRTYQKKPDGLEMKRSRRATCLPEDIDGIPQYILDDPEWASEIAGHHVTTRTRIRRGVMTADDENRLLVAVVVIRTLAGGLDRTIDWVLVSSLLTSFPIPYLHRRWILLYNNHKLTVEKLTSDFQSWFLEAYESGGIPAIDYDHLVDYDWDWLVNWVIDKTGSKLSDSTTRLPASRKQLDNLYLVKEDARTYWHDEMFDHRRPVHIRMSHISSRNFTRPLNSEDLRPAITDFDVAKSWVRASILTPVEDYNQGFAKQKLSQIGNALVAKASSALLEMKLLLPKNKGRPTPGRPYDISDHFHNAFRTRLDQTHFQDARNFKVMLDQHFANGETAEVAWMASDGATMAITNLQAAGRIRLVPFNVIINKFGLLDGGYQTKILDKTRLRFGMRIEPTETYIFDKDMQVIKTMYDGNHNPPNHDRAIPVWIDLNGELMREWWQKSIAAVLATMALRPGVKISEVGRIMGVGMEEWEVRLVVEWCIGVGALEVVKQGLEGWNVSEWWWLIAGWA